jgi:hypothetical protein
MAQQKKKKISILRRFLSKFKSEKKEDKDLRSVRTKATQKAAGDTDISEMLTPGVAPKEKIEPKTVERKPATAPRIPVSEAVSIAKKIVAMEEEKNAMEEEKKKKRQSTKLTGSRKGK